MNKYIDNNKILFIGKLADFRKYLMESKMKYATVKEMISKSLQ